MEGDAGASRLTPNDTDDLVPTIRRLRSRRGSRNPTDAPNQEATEVTAEDSAESEDAADHEITESDADDVAEPASTDAADDATRHVWAAAGSSASRRHLVVLAGGVGTGGYLALRSHQDSRATARHDAAAVDAAKDCVAATQAPDTAAMAASAQKIIECGAGAFRSQAILYSGLLVEAYQAANAHVAGVGSACGGGTQQRRRLDRDSGATARESVQRRDAEPGSGLPLAGDDGARRGQVPDFQARPGGEVTVLVEETERAPAVDEAAPNELARWHIRAAALAVDVLPGVAVVATMALVWLAVPTQSMWWWVSVPVLVGAALVTMVNRAILPAIIGWSLGRALLGIEVVRPDGTAVGVGRLMLRELAHLLDTLSVFVGWLWPLWDSRRRTFADLLLRTEVHCVEPDRRPADIRRHAAIAVGDSRIALRSRRCGERLGDLPARSRSRPDPRRGQRAGAQDRHRDAHLRPEVAANRTSPGPDR